jgi:hypothetical protein
MSATTRTVDPAEFVKSFMEDKYSREIKNWNEVYAPESLIFILKDLKAPHVIYAEISVALAEEVLPRYEEKYPKDLRPRQAIKFARDWLNDRTMNNAACAACAAAAAAAREAVDAANSDMWAVNSDDSNDSDDFTVVTPQAVNAARAAYDAVSSAAWAGAHVTRAASNINYASHYAGHAADNAARAGLSDQRIMDIIRVIGHRYYTFLKQNYRHYTFEVKTNEHND